MYLYSNQTAAAGPRQEGWLHHAGRNVYLEKAPFRALDIIKCIYLSPSLYIYIYIYTHIERERERDREGPSSCARL